MSHSFISWVILAVPAVAAVGFAVASCSSSKAAVGLGGGCSLNSDCNSPLDCVFGLCHEACETQRDCPNGQPCVIAPGGGGHICELPTEGNCTDGGTCPTGQACSNEKCGTACTASN